MLFLFGCFCCVGLFGILWFYAPDLWWVVVWFAWFGFVIGLGFDCYWLVWLCWLFFLARDWIAYDWYCVLVELLFSGSCLYLACGFGLVGRLLCCYLVLWGWVCAGCGVALVCGYLQFMLVIRLFVCTVVAYGCVVGVLV